MKNILLLPNTTKDPGLAHTRRGADILHRAGARVYLPDDRAGGACLPGYTALTPYPACFGGMDAAAVFGGDGTLLEAAAEASLPGVDVPLLGVNLGAVGFMCGVEKDEMEQLLPLLVSGVYQVEKRMMIDVAVTRGGRAVFTGAALNDAVVYKGEITKTIRMDVTLDGGGLSAFSGDGLIIATPTGSTAYSMAAGGPIIEPGAGCIVLTPICAHTLYAKSHILNPEGVIGVRISGHGQKAPYLSIDGHDGVSLEQGDIVTVTRSARVTRLIRLGEKTFYQRISQKLSSY